MHRTFGYKIAAIVAWLLLVASLAAMHELTACTIQAVDTQYAYGGPPFCIPATGCPHGAECESGACDGGNGCIGWWQRCEWWDYCGLFDNASPFL